MSGRPDGPLILIVDDSRDLREALAGLLTVVGYRVLTAEDGDQALRILSDQNVTPSLILLDLEMPVKSGFDFMDEQSQNPRLASIPTVVMTAEILAHPLEQCVATLVKPVPADRFVSIVKEYCGASAVVD